MNRLAIQLNNRGVEELKQGNMFQALELLSNASSIVTQGNHIHVDTPGQTYRYHWEDCSSSLAPQPSRSLQVSNEGSMSFLCLRFLRVTTLEGNDQLDIICPCGFAWVIWYNLAIVCTMFGTRLGEKGHLLLKRAYHLFEKVQLRIDAEEPSKHWSTLQLAVLNNQACIYHDFSMLPETLDKLDKLANTLFSAPMLHNGPDWKNFYLTLQILSRDQVAAAA